MTSSPVKHTRLLYDALNRCTALAADDESALQRFYSQPHQLATERQGAQHHSILRHGEQLLAQQQHNGADVRTTLLTVDRHASVLTNRFTPYGYCPRESTVPNAPGFNGESTEPLTGHYLLGSYRLFNTHLMRFTSPDSWSPFGKGGINDYTYCKGDPVNQRDPSGHSLLGILDQLLNPKLWGKAVTQGNKQYKQIKNVKQLEGITLFDDMYKKDRTLLPRLNIQVSKTATNPDAGKALGQLLNKGALIKTYDYSSVRVLGDDSSIIANSLANEISLPVKGYRGKSPTTEIMSKEGNETSLLVTTKGSHNKVHAYPKTTLANALIRS